MSSLPYPKTIRDGRRFAAHRLAVEISIGCPIPPGLEVHHLDGNPANFALDNLILLTAAEHISLHKARPRPLLRCPACGHLFFPKYPHRVLSYHPHATRLCSLSCAGRVGGNAGTLSTG